MRFDVRAAEHADIPALIAAYGWLFAPPGSKPPSWDERRAAVAVAAAIDSHDAVVLVAVAPSAGEPPGTPAGEAEDVAGVVIGFSTAYQDLHSVRFGDRAWVEDLAVDPDQRSRGVGKALLDAAKAWARERGATHLELDSAEARTDAHRFYEREGAEYRSISFGWQL